MTNYIGKGLQSIDLINFPPAVQSEDTDNRRHIIYNVRITAVHKLINKYKKFQSKLDSIQKDLCFVCIYLTESKCKKISNYYRI